MPLYIFLNLSCLSSVPLATSTPSVFPSTKSTPTSPSAQNKALEFSETNHFRGKMWMLQMSFGGFKKAGHPVVWFLSLAGRSTLTIIIAVVVCAVLLVLVLILVFIYKSKKHLAVCSHITHTFTHGHIFTSIFVWLKNCKKKKCFTFLQFFLFTLSLLCQEFSIQNTEETKKLRTTKR